MVRSVHYGDMGKAPTIIVHQTDHSYKKIIQESKEQLYL